MKKRKRNKSLIASTFSSGVLEKGIVEKYFGDDDVVFKPKDAAKVDYVVGWGRKPNTEKARKYAKQNGLEYYALEDGFIHSTGQGVLGAESCSLVVDSQGIYYDATQRSDLESLILERNNDLFDEVLYARAKNAIDRIITSKISKYNNGSYQLNYSTNKLLNEVVLVVDQTAGDMSLKYGGVDQNTFDRMLKTALTDNPNAEILIKTHPDVIAGKKKGSLSLPIDHPRVTIIVDLVNPLMLLKKVDIVYVATSQMGFDALLLGKKVVCFGMPFYAGWGLTIDKARKDLSAWQRRGKQRSLIDIFGATYILYSRYIHPDTKKRCELEEVLDYFELQFRNKLKLGHAIYCINFTRWKRNYIKAFLSSDTGLIFISSADQAVKKGFNSNSQLVTWSSKNPTEIKKLIKKFNISVWNIEDGFLRSTGLGTDLTAPASLVLDCSGIYYNPRTSSDLEKLLQTKEFEEGELLRAELLKDSLLENELSKYNLGVQLTEGALKAQQGQRIILVPGQVEDDASIKTGCVDINTNAALLKSVRAKNPDAYLIYKPHPDVVSGNRKGKITEMTQLENSNLVLTDVSITDCLAVVDEVHTMTSLVGFEGLLRDIKVVCYGLPFYSGWGLTEDIYSLSRRTRKLKLNELIAGTLIDYPRYINWQTGEFTTPEVIVEQLKYQIIRQGGKQQNQIFWLKRQLRKLQNIYKGIFVSGR